MNTLRHQLPVYSPVPAAALRAAVSAAAGLEDATHDLRIRLREVYGASDVLLLDSGTSALALAIRASLARKRGTVVLPAFGCFDLATAVNATGARCVFYDLDPATLAPDWISFRRALDHDPSSVLVVHHFGIPAPLDEIERHIATAGAVLIEDAAQGSGGTFGQKPVGSRGPLSVLSFGRGKGWTGGSGGALLGIGAVGEELIAPLIPRFSSSPRGIRSLAHLAAQKFLGYPLFYGIPASVPALRLGETVYCEPWQPSAMAMSAIAAAAATWEAAEREVPVRRRNAARLRVHATGALSTPPIIGGGKGGFLRLPVLARGVAIGRLADEGARRHGVYRSYPSTLANVRPLAGNAVNAAERMPGAEVLAAALFTFPTHGQLTEKDLRELELILGKAVLAY